jgi:N-glycosylase/DNA lyase
MVKSLCIQYSPPLLLIPPAKSTIATGLLTPSDSNDPCTPLASAVATPEPELESYHPFPPPSRLSAPDVAATLRSLGFGYRADFIQKTAKMLVDAHGVSTTKGQEGPEKWLETLRSMSTANAREELLKLMGVGRKVADCILLMSLDKVKEPKKKEHPSRS